MTTVASPATLRAAVLPRAGVLTHAALVTVGVGVLALSAQAFVPLPYGLAPITLQTLSVLVLAAAYGPALGALTFAAYLAVGLAGAPLFSQGRGGAEIVTTVTMGYLVGMLAATVLVGYLANRRWDRSPAKTVVAMVIGNVVVYAGGVTAWVLLGTPFVESVVRGVAPYLIGDAVKIAIAAAALPSAWALVRRLHD